MLRMPPLCLTALTLATLAPAQNLVVNGDFEATTIAPWVVTKNTHELKLFNTNGSVVSQAFANSPGVLGLGGLTIEQEVSVTPGAFYEIRADLAAVSKPLVGSFIRIDAFVFASNWTCPRRECDVGFLRESG